MRKMLREREILRGANSIRPNTALGVFEHFRYAEKKIKIDKCRTVYGSVPASWEFFPRSGDTAIDWEYLSCPVT